LLRRKFTSFEMWVKNVADTLLGFAIISAELGRIQMTWYAGLDVIHYWKVLGPISESLRLRFVEIFDDRDHYLARLCVSFVDDRVVFECIDWS
jgi:hypothetical protein